MIKVLTNNFLSERLHQKRCIAENHNLIRTKIPFEYRHRVKINLNKKTYIDFTSNDYLGLSSSKSILKAFKRGVRQHGFGSGSSVAISGYRKEQETLERKFAKFLNRDAAVFFNSGYLANLGIISALSIRQDSIISDKLSHASILDGILLSRAKHYRFRHNNIAHLENLLSNATEHRFIISESVFSMEGDISPVTSIASIAKKYKATLIIDDAHGFGILGKDGGGIGKYDNLFQDDVPCLVVPLGKAMGGYGAIVAGTHEIVQAIIQWARSYRYTTALPSAIITANLKALESLKKGNKRRKHLQTLIQFFIANAKKLKLPLLSEHPTPIKIFLVKTNKKAQHIQSYMLAHGFFVSCIRPPTVPEGKARIRISLNYYHSKKDIEKLLHHLATIYEKQ